MENQSTTGCKNKIFFSYPTLIRPNMPETVIYQPEPLITDVEKGSVHPMVITTGLVLSSDQIMYTQVDVLFEGEGVMMPDDRPGKMENPYVRHLQNEHRNIYLSNLFINQVLFPDAGCYEVIVKAFIAVDEDPSADGILVDSFSSYFYVEIAQETNNGADL